MRICNFSTGGETRLGALDSNTVVDLAAAMDVPAFSGTKSFIEGGSEALDLARKVLGDASDTARQDLGSVKLEAPLLPSTVLCSGSNYRAHNAEKANTPLSGKEPEFFLKTADCVVGPGAPIVFDSALTNKLDAETELAVVIGKPGRHIAVKDALSHVFGYTVSNDVTARDKQVRRSPEGFTWYELGRGKAFDSSLPLGPVIVTDDEIPDPQALMLRTRINGELRQMSSTGDMIWSCAELIHFFSTSFTLKPGMVILTGTPAGTAWSVDKDLGGNWTPAEGLVAATRYCVPGDVVESEIVEIGVLSNPVV